MNILSWKYFRHASTDIINPIMVIAINIVDFNRVLLEEGETHIGHENCYISYKVEDKGLLLTEGLEIIHAKVIWDNPYS